MPADEHPPELHDIIERTEEAIKRSHELIVRTMELLRQSRKRLGMFKEDPDETPD